MISCVGAFFLLGTIFTLSVFVVFCSSWSSSGVRACVGAPASAGVGTWVRACRGVGAGVSMFSRANRVCRATNQYEGSVFGTHSFHPSKPSVGIRSCPAFWGTLQGGKEPPAHRSFVGFCCSQQDGSVVTCSNRSTSS